MFIRKTTHDVILSQLQSGSGFVAWNPDSGEEYTPNHPVLSGECVDAERIRPSTPQEDTLWTAFQEQFMRAEALAAALADAAKRHAITETDACNQASRANDLQRQLDARKPVRGANGKFATRTVDAPAGRGA
jgi:hypothetical protein